MRGAQLRASPRSTIAQSRGARPGGRGTTVDRAEEIRRAELRELRHRHGGDTAPAEPSPKDAPQERPRPRLRLAPPVPVAVVRTPFVMLLIMVVIAGVLGILVLNTRINQNAFQLAALRDKQNELDLRQQQLEQQIAKHESPGSLAAAAAKLGLVAPGAPAFITLPDGKIIGVPKPATGTPSITSQ